MIDKNTFIHFFVHRGRRKKKNLSIFSLTFEHIEVHLGSNKLNDKTFEQTEISIRNDKNKEIQQRFSIDFSRCGTEKFI